MMNTCEAPVTGCSGLMGCGGRLCRNMRSAMTKMSISRAVTDELGQPDYGNIEKSGVLCGFITRLPPASSPNLAIPGISSSSSSNVRLTVVASTLSPQAGDIVDCAGEMYTVELQLGGTPTRFSLIETEGN